MTKIRLNTVSLITALSLNSAALQAQSHLLSENVGSTSQRAGQRRLRTETQVSSNLVMQQELCKVDFTNPNIGTTNANISIEHARYDSGYNGWLLEGRHHDEYRNPEDTVGNFHVNTVIDKKPGMYYSLDLVHLCPNWRSNLYININGERFRPSHVITDPNYKFESFDITRFIKNGENQIWISTTMASYCIQSLAVVEKNTSDTPPSSVCMVDFQWHTIEANHAQVQMGPGLTYNSYDGGCWNMGTVHEVGVNYLQVSSDFQKDPSKSYSLDLVHLCTYAGKDLAYKNDVYAKVTIEVNGEVVKTGYNPGCGYVQDSFDITQYVQDGKNIVTIKVDNAHLDLYDPDYNWWSAYWIQSLAIREK